MEELKIDFAGIEFKNPILTASMTFGWNGYTLKKAGLSGAGGVVCKSIGSPAETFQHPKCGRMVLYRYKGIPVGMQNNEIFSTINVDRWIKGELKIAAEGGARMVVSIVANPDPKDTAELAKKIAETGLVDMFELNVSCPMPAADVGMNIGKVPGLVAKQVKAVKKACPHIPLMPKLTPNISDIKVIARACEDSGADAIAATNSIQGLVGLDVETGKPLLPAFGGYTGPCVHPVMLRIVAQIAQTVNIPVSGIGGVSDWRHAVEMMMVGASTVQVGTAVMWHGYRVINEILDGMKSFIKRKGYKTIKEIVGMSLKHIITTEEMAKLPPKVANLDKTICTGCNRCIQVCGYNAIDFGEDNKIKIIEDKCDGCGLCVEICPKSALKLVEKKQNI